MQRSCVSMSMGEFVYQDGKKKSVSNEQRQLCHNNGVYKFVYGSEVGSNYVQISGQSVKQETNKDKLVFKVNVLINHKKTEELFLNYQEVMDLFTKNKKSKLLSNLSIKHLSIKQKASQGTQSRELATKKKLFQPGKNLNHVINPLTNKEILIGGPTYNKLCETGLYKC